MILHFSHIGLTDGRTFTLIRSQKFVDLVPLNPRLGSGDRYGRRYRAEEAPRSVKLLRCRRIAGC